MYELVSFVTRGITRKVVLMSLDKPKTPTELATATKIHRPTISRSIKDLENKGLLECIPPNERMGRYYQITKLGKQVLQRIGND